MTVRRLRIPLKARLTLAFAAGMAVVLTGVGAFVYVNLRDDLRASVDSGLQSRAQVIAANASRADPSLGGGRHRRLIDPDEAFAQVLAPSGRIVETTRGVAKAPLVSAADLAALTKPRFVDSRPAGLDLSRLLVVPVQKAHRTVFVVVGATFERQPGGAPHRPRPVRGRVSGCPAPVVAHRLGAGGRGAPAGRAHAS